MRKLVFGMLVSLDGYIAGPPGGPQLPVPNDELHWHFNDRLRHQSLQIYGRRMYEVMQYWQTYDSNPEARPVGIDFARAWQTVPKLVVSTTLDGVGPNARLIRDRVGETIAELKQQDGAEMEVSGPTLAASLAELGLIDEYLLYVQPVVLGGGKPFFGAGTPGDLKLLGTKTMPGDTVLMRYAPA